MLIERRRKVVAAPPETVFRAFSGIGGERGWPPYNWLWRIRYTGPAILAIGLALVLGGAIGNVIDRIVLGSVVDFIQVLIAGWPFPSFNVADSAITVGAVLLIIDALFFSGKAGKSEG